MKSLQGVFFSISILALIMIQTLSCTKEREEAVTPGIIEKVESVCLFDGLGLRLEPNNKGKWLGSISLGEIVYWLGETRIDSTDRNKKYIKVMLSDGKEGWSLDWGIATNAKLGAIKESAPVYKRPDMLTLTDKTFEFMDMVAVISDKGEWLEVTGEQRKKSGWIRKDKVATEKSDATTAILAAKKLKEGESIEKVIEASPYPQSYFIQKLREQIGRDEADLTEPETSILESDSL